MNDNKMRLRDKVILITAAGQGIGRASALACAREGARVIATDINAGLLASLGAESPGIDTRVLDVRDGAAVAARAAALPQLDGLFNCAGYVHEGSVLACDEAAWDFSFDLNVKGAYRLLRAFLPGMLEKMGHQGSAGSIVNMASMASSIKGFPNRFAYGATKAAVIGLTKAIAADFVAQRVRCNAICPGTVRTPSLGERVAALGGDPKTHWRNFTQRQPMGRLGEAWEIAALAVYLASDESAFTTGAIHIIDGGWSN